MCYQGNCVDGSTIFKNATLGNPCNRNPCMNKSICAFNSTTNSLYCICPYGISYSGNY